MDTLSINDGCHYNYHHSSSLNRDESTYRHENSPPGCNALRSFWQHGKFVTQHCYLPHTALGKYHETIPLYWQNKPGGDQKPQCSFQCENPRVPPIGADTERAESHRKYVTETESNNKRKAPDLRIKILKKNLKKSLQSYMRTRLNKERKASIKMLKKN
jgi:hypothetical protein